MVGRCGGLEHQYLLAPCEMRVARDDRRAGGRAEREQERIEDAEVL